MAEQLPEPVVPKNLEGIEKKLVAVDGSFVPILARIARLAWTWRKKDQPTCGYRLHTHFEILRGLPKRIETTPANPKGEDAEQAVLGRTIELFFKMFKQLLGCRHLLSTKQNGVEIQVYAALIACMLMLIYTGRAPNKRTFEMLRFYLVGLATIDEIVGHIDKQKSRSP